MDPYDLAVRRALGLPTEPEEEEGSDFFQPIRTFFGATAGAIPAAVSKLMPDAYEKARQENLEMLGLTEDAPLYEQIEAAPGAGDVAAQFVPESVRESALGRAAGPVARMVGNIAGDPTTYTPWILAKAGKAIATAGGAAKAVEVGSALRGAVMTDAARAAAMGAPLDAAEVARRLAQAEKIRKAETAAAITKPLHRRAYLAAEAIKDAEPLALGSAAAVAYGPGVVRGMAAGGEEMLAAIEEGNVEEALVSGANTALMGGLGYMMGRGLTDAVKARRALTRSLVDQGVIPEETRGEFIGPTRRPEDVRAAGYARGPEGPAGFEMFEPTGDMFADRVSRLQSQVAAAPPLEVARNIPRDERGLPLRGRLIGRQPTEPLDWRGLQEGVGEPLSVPARVPGPLDREVPAGFRGRVLSDEELLARLQEETERARARALEASRPERLEGAAPEMIPLPGDRRAQAFLEPEPGSVLDVQPRPGQRVLPGMREPVAPPAAPPVRALRRRSKAQQLRLEVEEAIDTTPVWKALTPEERNAFEAGYGGPNWRPSDVTKAAVEEVRRKFDSVEAARAELARRREVAARVKAEKAGAAAKAEAELEVRRAESVRMEAEADVLMASEHGRVLVRERAAGAEHALRRRRKRVGKRDLADVQSIAEGQVRREFKEQLRAGRTVDDILETAAERPVEPTERLPEDTTPAPWDEAPRQATVRSLVDPEEMAAAKLTPGEEAYLKERIVEGGASEREAFDDILKQREYRARNPEPVEPGPFPADTEPTTPPTSPRIEPVATEATPTARAPEAPAAEAPAGPGPIEQRVARELDGLLKESGGKITGTIKTRFNLPLSFEVGKKLTPTQREYILRNARHADARAQGNFFVDAGTPAPRAAEAAPISEAPAVEPTRKPSTPEERLGRSPEEWADSVIRNERNAEIKARLQESREELVQRVREIQEKDRIDKAQVGVKWTEEAARKTAYAARTELVNTKGWNVKKASMPGIDVSPAKVEPPVVKAETPEPTPEAEPKPSVFEEALEGEGRGAEPAGRGAKKAAAGLDREGEEVGPQKAGKAWRLRDELAEQGAGLSPATKKYLAVKAQAGKPIEELLDEIGDRRLKNGAFVRAWKERFAAFDQAFDQNLKAKQNPRQARGNAIKAIAQLFEQSEQKVRSMIGEIEAMLGERSPVEPAPAPRLEAAPKRPTTLADAPKMVEEKRALERPIQEAIARDERPSKEAIGTFLAGYRDLAARIAGLGLRGQHPMLRPENLGVRNLQNLMELLHPGEFAKLQRAGFNRLIDRLAELEGIEIPKLEAPAPKPKAEGLRPPKALTPIQAREGGVRVFRAPGGTKVELVRVNDQYRVDFEPNERVKDLEGFGKDVDAILADGNVAELKGLDTVLTRKQLDEFVKARGLAEVAQEDGSVIYRVVKGVAGMEVDPAEAFRDVAGVDWTRPIDLRSIAVGGARGPSTGAFLIADAMDDPRTALPIVEPIARRFGVKLDRDAPVVDVSESRGTFHQVFKLTGQDKDGREFVIRIGKSPAVLLSTPEQRALVAGALHSGEFTHRGERFAYSVHQFAEGPGEPVDLNAYHGAAQYRDLTRQSFERALPAGISMGDYMQDARKLWLAMSENGLNAPDLHVGGWWKAQQTGYIPLRPGEPSIGIVRVGEGGKRYRLVVVDPGGVWRLDHGGEHRYIAPENYIALMESRLAHTPDDRLSVAEQQELDRRFTEAETEGLDIGDGMKVVDHHNQFGWAYAARVGVSVKGAAKALKGIFDELVGELSPKTRVDFGGITTSPYLSGVFRENQAARTSKVFVNVMDLVHSSKGYDDFVRKVGHTLGHEVAHLAGTDRPGVRPTKGELHGARFTDLVNYVENLVKVQGWHERAVQRLKEAGFTEDLYRKLKESDLTEQYRDVQREVVSGRDWRKAQAFEGVPRGAAAGSAAAKSNLAGGGAQAPPGRGADGLQRGGDVRGGRGGQAGDLLPGTAAREGVAERPAEGGEVGPRAGQGDDIEESIIAGLETGGGPRGSSLEETAKLLNQLVTTKQIPVTQAERTAMDAAVRLAADLSDDEIAKYVKVAPDPRGREGVLQGPINTLIEGLDLPPRSKARMVIYSKILDDAGLTLSSKPRPWHLVDREVREMLGLRTMEDYVQMFRHKGGGLHDRDVQLLKTTRYEFARQLDYLDGQWRKATLEGDSAAADKLFAELQKVRDNSAAAQSVLKDYLTGLARGLGMARAHQLKADPQQLLRTMIHSNIAEKLRTRVGEDVDVQAEATRLTDMFFRILRDRGDWNELRAAVNLAMKRTTWDKALEFYKAGLLGWPSEIANFASNGLFRGLRFIEDTAAGAIDAGVSKLTGKERSVYIGEAKVAALAARRAWLEAIPKFIQAELSLLRLEGGDLAKMLEHGSLAEDFMMGLGAIEGKVGNFVRFHFDSMQNADTLFKHLSQTDTLYREVYRGLKKGDRWLTDMTQSGEDIAVSVERIVQKLRENADNARAGKSYDPDLASKSAGMFEKAKEVADRDTYQAELGDAGRGIQSFLREHSWMQVLVPFFRTPYNIFGETMVRTPFGLVRPLAGMLGGTDAGAALGFRKAHLEWNKLTPAEKVQEVSKPFVGSAIMGTLYTLASTGDITGGGPTDYESQEALRATGWQPYSIRLGDQWLSYQRMEPLSSLMGMAADMAEAIRNGDVQSFNTGAQKLADSIAENLTNKTFLSGFSALTGALSNPRQELGSFVKQMQQSVVPNSLGFVPFGHFARAIDPVYRQADPMTMDAFLAKVPFASETLEPSYGPTGEERRRPGGFMERLISPFARQTMKEGPLARGADELVRVQAVPKAAMRYWTSPQGYKVKLTPEERQHLAKAIRAATEIVGGQMVNDPTYKRLPKDENDPNYVFGGMTRQKMVDRLITKYRARAMKQIMPQLKERARQAYREREA